MGVKIAGGLFALWLLNLACAYWLSMPWAYCWLWAGLSPVLQSIASPTILFCALWFFGALVLGRVRQAVIAAMAMFVLGGADGFAKALLTLPGNSCA